MRGKRLARLIQYITLFRGQASWNARRLAERFGCSRRNIYRDLALLELAGVPFYYDPDFGEGGGFRIRPDYFFPTVQLNQQECIDLAVLTRGVATGHGIPLLDSATEVRDKLMATVPAKHQDTIRTASELFEILSLRLADHSKCRGVMLAFQEALLLRRQLEGIYQSPREKRPVKVRLQPRRVFLTSICWYAVCYDNDAKENRLYRLARFKDVRVTKQAMTVPEEFSLREFLGNAWTVYRGDRDWPVEILFDPEAAPLVSEVRWHETQKLLPQKNGSVIFQATVSGFEEIKYWILNWGPRATVLKPRELADEVRRLAGAVMANYRQQSDRHEGQKPLAETVSKRRNT